LYKLLIVDDEGFIRRGILSSVHWQEIGIGEIIEAEDGQEAYELALRHQPHIVLSDIRIPKLNGVDLAAALRERISCQIIFMSAYDDKEYYKSAIKFSVLAYVEKPINLEELIDALKRAVAACRIRETTVITRFNKNAVSDAETELCKKILDIIEENFSNPNLNISFICRKVFTGRSLVCSVFKHATGKTVNGVITEYRMAKAAGLLRDTRLSLSDVAVQTGLNDPGYFTKFFRKHMGMTPSEYRKRTSHV